MVAPISSIDQDNPTIGFYFDARWYLERYPDVADAGIDAAEHFMSIGFREGRDPNPAFITLDYFAANPDLNSSDTINPFLHYILYGASERRRLKPT